MSQPQAQPGFGDISRDYVGFVKDTAQLVKELSGYATRGDEDAKNYSRTAVPVLQNFINQSNEQRNLPDPSARKNFLRESLQTLVSGLQSALASQGTAMGDPGLDGSEAGGGVGVGEAGGVGEVGSQYPPIEQSSSMFDTNNIEMADYKTLKPIGDRINKRLLTSRIFLKICAATRWPTLLAVSSIRQYTNVGCRCSDWPFIVADE